MLYDVEKMRRPVAHGALDTRLVCICTVSARRAVIVDAIQGTSSKTGICETCGEGLSACNGHFGHVRLALPAFHIGYLKLVMGILQDICKV